ncbi:MFS general substrate transporter [Lepidopterella palustris CBS 459.81]|uniref:MFS general substrate transporter n=1 Tax=Lepidopterella palustris CBS 459.81 TaxID=1314670 RepID=A0A8E2JIT8_9PEZI|nr:MFS general substrate transporter [Lepidopterella palustris CBS 459.81]
MSESKEFGIPRSCEIEKNSDSEKSSNIDTPIDIEKVAETWADTSPISVELNKRVTEKFDKHIIPWLFGFWLCSYIDRSNIGNARIDGLAKDLDLGADKFNIALCVFYVAYICVDVPSNLVLKYFQAGRHLPFLLTSWGVVSLCLGFVKSYTGLLVARFFLGIAEGGLLGGMLIYLAMYYRRHELLYRITLFYCAAPLSGAFGGLLATGLGEIKSGGYNGWPFIFFVEGGLTVIYGVITFFVLPHTPSHAKFLTEEELAVALARMKLDAHGSTTSGDIAEETFSWHWVRRGILNWNTIILSLNYFSIITPIYSFSLFLPTIIKSLGYTAVKAQLLTVPPNMAAFFTVLIVGHYSDKLKVRGPFMLGGIMLAIIGYIILIASTHPLTRYGGTFFVGAGIFPCSPLIMGWLINNLAPHYVRATGSGLQIMVANMAGFIAVFAYLEKDAPRYITGHAINLGVLGLALMLTSTGIIYCSWENSKRAQGERDYRLAEGDEGMLGYRHPAFRYTI